jgi:hypothetical protein
VTGSGIESIVLVVVVNNAMTMNVLSMQQGLSYSVWSFFDHKVAGESVV